MQEIIKHDYYALIKRSKPRSGRKPRKSSNTQSGKKRIERDPVNQAGDDENRLRRRTLEQNRLKEGWGERCNRLCTFFGMVLGWSMCVQAEGNYAAAPGWWGVGKVRINSRETLGIEVNNLCWRFWEGGVANAVFRCVAPEGASFTPRLRDYNAAALIGIQFRRGSKKSALER